MRRSPSHADAARHSLPKPPARPRRRHRLAVTALLAVLVAVTAFAVPGLAGSMGGGSGSNVTVASWWRSLSSPAAQRHSHHRHHHRKSSPAKHQGATGVMTPPQETAAGPSTPSSSPVAPPTSSTGGGGATTSGGTSQPAAPVAGSADGGNLPYSADSFFRKALPANTPVSATNAQEVAWAKANNADPYLKIRGAQGVGWGIAYALSGCSDPIYKIGPGGSVPTSQQHLRTVGFHAPVSVWKNIPQNGDAPFLIVDTCGTSARPGGLSVWGANAVVSGNTVNVSAAGSFAHDSNGLDRRNPASDSQLNERSAESSRTAW